MIKGKGLNELKKYRMELINRGIEAGEIPDETFSGHHPDEDAPASPRFGRCTMKTYRVYGKPLRCYARPDQ